MWFDSTLLMIEGDKIPGIPGGIAQNNSFGGGITREGVPYWNQQFNENGVGELESRIFVRFRC